MNVDEYKWLKFEVLYINKRLCYIRCNLNYILIIILKFLYSLI